MASYREYLVDQKTNWQAVQNEIAKSLAGVKNPVNPNVQVPTLAQLSGNPAAGAGTFGGTVPTATTGTATIPDPYAAAKESERRSAFAILEDTFRLYNLEELVPTITQFLKDGLSAAEATLQLRQTPTYKIRFQGNEGRIAKGLAAYSPAEYLAAEESYANLLNSNNLSGLANKPVFTKLISGAVSPLEVQDRINKVFNKIDNAK